MARQRRGTQGQPKRRAGKSHAPLATLITQSLPIASCMMSKNLFENGIGHVVLGRRLPDGRMLIGMFLVDVYCLGIKDAAAMRVSQSEYQSFLTMTGINDPLENASPCCAKKLVEQSIDYAAKIGISPHKDYALARGVLAGIDSSDCKAVYAFGCNGKPYYISGPNDTPERIRQIHELLQKHCGKGGYDFLNALDSLDDEDDEDILAAIPCIDDPFEVDDVLEQMDSLLPVRAHIRPEIFAQMRSQYDWLQQATASVEIVGTSYMGDGGGIACELKFDSDTDEHVMHVSLTHLTFADKQLPCYKAIANYQKRRVQHLKKQGQYGGRFLDAVSA